MLIPIFLLVGLAFWFLMPNKSQPVIINDQIQTSNSSLTNLNKKINSLEEKVDSLESSNSALLSKINSLQTAPKTNNAQPAGKKTPVLLPINPGGNINSTTWTNLTSGTITVDPKDYPGYKNAYLIIDLSVYVGQGTAYAQIVNAQNGLAIIPSMVSTGSYSPVSLTSAPFRLPEGQNQYTIQLYTQVPNYPAQAGSSFLQITY